jgi:6-phosphogluconolactonase
MIETARAAAKISLVLADVDGMLVTGEKVLPMLHETSRWAVAAIAANAEARITMTYPALDSSRGVAFLVTGKEKRGVVARAQAGDRTLPAAVVHPVGLVHWFTDRAAAPERAN